jgi:type IX secretion system PorP/SprF family membrane protein
MIMKISILFLLLVTVHNTMAQQKPHYTQYVINNFIINPAITGIENYTDIRLSHRRQWVGLDDAPVTTYFTAHTAIGKQDDKLTATSFAKSGENIRGKSYWDEYQAAPAHHGVGVQIMDDKTGPIQNFTAHLTYAYHVGLSPKANLSAGIGIGISRFGLNTNKLSFGPDFPIDPAVKGSNILNKSNLDVDAGVFVYSDTFFLGLSALQIVPQKIDFSTNVIKVTEGKKVPHLFATAGYRFLLSEDFNVLPSMTVKYISPAPVQMDANVKLQYQDLFWLGTNYRFKYGYSFFAGFNAYNIVNVSYAFDRTTTKLNTISQGTHEVILGFNIGNRYSMNTCPTRVW